MPTPPRRPWSYSLRTMFLVMTVVALLLVIYRQQCIIWEMDRVIHGQSVQIESMQKELDEGTTVPKFNRLPL